LRVSTGERTKPNQGRERAAVGKRHGWSVVQVFSDNGSGAKYRVRRFDWYLDQSDGPTREEIICAVHSAIGQ